jgi:hypothetical protein
MVGSVAGAIDEIDWRTNSGLRYRNDRSFSASQPLDAKIDAPCAGQPGGG